MKTHKAGILALTLTGAFALLPVRISAQQGSNGDLYALGSTGQWSTIGVSIPTDVVDIEGNAETMIARTSAGAFLQWDAGSGSWQPWAMSLPTGTMEVRFLGDLVGSDAPLVARTNTQAMYLLRSSTWMRMSPDFPTGTIRFGVGGGLFAVTSGGRILVLSDSTWLDVSAVPGLAAGLIYHEGSLYSLQPDGTWQRFDLSTQDFVAADVAPITGARTVLSYEERLTVWK